MTKRFEGVRHVMLDFDGPLCHVFAGRPARAVAERLRTYVASVQTVPQELTTETDPLGFVRSNGFASPVIAAEVAARLNVEEIAAASVAEPTPGALETLEACVRSGLVVTVVSNNSPDAVKCYLVKHNLARFVSFVSARPADPGLMKPHPFPLLRAGELVGVPMTSSLLVGDSDTDIIAAREAGAAVVGYANKPGKAASFQRLGADMVVDDMREVAAVLDSPPQQALNRP